MLKYLYVKETFSEVPNEISLCIELSGCTIHCEGCHSPELWSNKGEVLTPLVLSELINKHNGITCVCILGGEDIIQLNTLFKYIKKNTNLKTCWYTGYDKIPKEINLCYLDFIKIGHYNGHPLTDKETNQRMYQVSVESIYDEVSQEDKILKFNSLEDITNVFWNNKDVS